MPRQLKTGNVAIQLRERLEELFQSADDTGCTDGLTVVYGGEDDCKLDEIMGLAVELAGGSGTRHDDCVEMLDNVTAALETMLAHHPGDAAREALAVRARRMADRLMIRWLEGTRC